MARQQIFASSLLLPVILLTLSLALLIFLSVSLAIISENNFYQKEFENNGVYSDFGGTELPNRISRQLVTYFQDETDEPPNIGEFNEAEKSHLLDVKRVIVGIREAAHFITLLFLLALLAALFLDKRLLFENLARLSLASGGLTLIISFLLVVLALNFSWAFTSFHHMFFPQGNWQFPSGSLLIRLFPEQTFFDFFMAILFRSTLLGLLFFALGSAGFLLRKKYKQKSKYKKYGQA